MRRFGILLGAMGCAAAPGDGVAISASVEDASASFACSGGQLDQAELSGGSIWVQCTDASAANYATVSLSGVSNGLTEGSYDIGALDGLGASMVSATVQLGGSFDSPSHTFSTYDTDSSGTVRLWQDFEPGGVLVLTLDLDDVDGATGLFEVNTPIAQGG